MIKKKYIDGNKLSELSKYFGRTEYAIEVRLIKMGLIDDPQLKTQTHSKEQLNKNEISSTEDLSNQKQNGSDVTQEVIISNTIQDQNARKLSNLPKLKNLQYMSFMGIDKAYIALFLQSHKVAVKKVLSGVQKHRSRYKNIITNNINSYLYLDSLKLLTQQ